ncbi:MAG: site-2 protease family protein [Thermodesulfobacteriota bacterium]
MLPEFDINRIVVMVTPLLFAVSLHEAAHGYAALKMGDDTAARAGRITLNPIRHVDPVGSVVLPLLLAVFNAPFVFGYARPVPVNPALFRNWKKGTLWVSSAGVLANLVFMMMAGVCFRILLIAAQAALPMSPLALFLVTDLLLMLGYFVLINAVLAVFNLIPIPPLDGSNILLVFLPPAMRKRFASMGRFGIILLLFLLTIKADWFFNAIWFVIMPLVHLALGSGGLNFIAGSSP